MKAIVLCAGRGTRLGSLTETRPKAMLSVAGRPILEHAINNLARQGIRDIGINLWYRGNAIESYFGDGRPWGTSLYYVWENSLSGTAGALRGFREFLTRESSFLVIYGDIVTDELFEPLSEAHERTRATVTMMVHRRPEGSNSVVSFERNGLVTEFRERPETEGRCPFDSWVNSGIYLVSAGLLSEIPATGAVDFPKDLFPGLLARRELYAMPIAGYRCAIDSPERLEQVRTELPASISSIGARA